MYFFRKKQKQEAIYNNVFKRDPVFYVDKKSVSTQTDDPATRGVSIVLNLTLDNPKDYREIHHILDMYG